MSSEILGVSFNSANKKAVTSKIVRIVGCALIIIPIFHLLRQHLADMDADQLAAALRSISLQSIALAGFFTAISLIAVARYDVLAIRQLGLNVPENTAVKGGFVAVSISQALGFGLIVGSICRWRFYRNMGVGPAEAGLISGLVLVGFLNGFAITLAAAVLIAPEGLMTLTGMTAGTLRALAAVVLIVAAGLMLFSVVRPELKIAGRRIALPKLRAVRAQITLAALDVIPAGIALWVLIPSDVAPSLLAVLPVYLAALGLGLVSNTPGGLGVLELTCLMALPVLPPEQLLAALIAYRGIYYGLPVVVAVVMLVVREFWVQSEEPQEDAKVSNADIGAALASSGCAEAQLVFLGDKNIIFSDCSQGFLMYAASGNSLIALSDPVGPKELWPELLGKFETEATSKMFSPAFYKCGTEFAAFVEMNGHFATQIASEGVIDLSDYGTSGSSKRELRRKLKAAGSLELIRHLPGAAPLAWYASVDEAWTQTKGAARGFSMGYFKPDYIRRFASVEARLDGQTVAFLTIWSSGDGREHALDVMRMTDAAPDGTMHALVHEAAIWAREEGAERFSLSAVPLMVTEPCNFVERMIAYVYKEKPQLHQSQGLYRFKNAFRPVWEPRFGAAPSLYSALIAARDVNHLINSPAPTGKSRVAVVAQDKITDGELAAA